MATATSRARSKGKAKDSDATNLIAALKFVQAAQRTDGLPYQAHCKIAGGNVLAFNGGVAAMHAIDTDLTACPHTATLIKALERCDSTIAITLTDGGKLSIKSGKLKTLVPCLPIEDMHEVVPDDACANIDDRLKIAMLAASEFLDDKPNEIYTAGVLLDDKCSIGTNRHILVQYWHGIDLPPGILIPKASVIALCKTDKKFSRFGFSKTSATFYYEDGSYIKTQLFDGEAYPNYAKLLNVSSNAFPLPDNFYQAVETVLPFAENSRIYFLGDSVSTHAQCIEGASFEIIGIPKNRCYNGNYLKTLKPYVKSIDFGETPGSAALFFGDNLRGVMMPIHFK